MQLAAAASKAALDALANSGNCPQRLAAAIDAQEGGSQSVEGGRRGGARAARLTWLREGERPSRGLTPLVHPPRETQAVAALQDKKGRLVTDVKRLPQMVEEYWGEVCTATTIVSEDARAAVISAWREATLVIPAVETSEVGRPEVSDTGFEAVLKTATPG